MSKLLLSLAAVVAGVAGTAGAAVATEPAPQPTAAPAAGPAVAAPAAGAAVAAPAAGAAVAAPAVAPAVARKTKKAVAVVVVRTGGGQTGQSVFTLVGAADKEDAEVLRLASTPAFQSLRPKYGPAHPARDRYTYRVEAGYRDNSKKRVIVVEGTPGTPKVALDVIRMMTNMSPPDLSDVKVAFPPGFPFN